MKKYKYQIIALIILSVGGFFVYKEFHKKKNQDQIKNDIDTIISSGRYKSDRSNLESFDSGYISNWADAVRNGKASFDYKNSQYNTQGGKLIVNKNY